MAQQAPPPVLHHLLRACCTSTNPVLASTLGREALKAAAAGAQGLPRGAQQPCLRCGACSNQATGAVRKLPRGAVRRQLAQQQQRQQQQQHQGSPAKQAIRRWLMVETCQVCSHENKRMLQHPPGKQQQQQQQQPQPQPQPQPQQHQQQQQLTVTMLDSEPPCSFATLKEPATGKHDSMPGRPQAALQREPEQQIKQQMQTELADEGSLADAALSISLPDHQQAVEPQQEAGHQHKHKQAAAAECTQEPEAQVSGAATTDADTGSAEAPPSKKRRLSWKEDLQAVRMIEPKRSVLTKIVSWHRQARTWKAAGLSLHRSGGKM